MKRKRPPEEIVDMPQQRHPNPGFIGRPTPRILKRTPSGRFLGWYRLRQIRGLPSSRTPDDADFDAKVSAFEKETGYLKDAARRAGGKASGRARQAKASATAERIRIAQARLPEGRGAQKAVANMAGVSARHLRRLKNKKRT